MIEILVVLGIIVLLAGILLPVAMKAYGKAVSVRMAADLAAISSALEAYKQDHKTYPLVRQDMSIAAVAQAPNARANPPTGAQLLCWALIGPAAEREPTGPATARRKQDGKDGAGFRTRYTAGPDGTFGNADDSRGKPYGPYLNPEQFRYGVPGDPVDTSEARVLEFCLLDRNDQPILYFPAAPAKPDPRVAYVSRAETSYYDADDNLLVFDTASPANALRRIRLLLGDKNANGVLDGSETAVNAPFLLWSAGPDDVFGPRGDEASPAGPPDEFDVPKCDDVTNFR